MGFWVCDCEVTEWIEVFDYLRDDLGFLEAVDSLDNGSSCVGTFLSDLHVVNGVS